MCLEATSFFTAWLFLDFHRLLLRVASERQLINAPKPLDLLNLLWR